MLRLQHDEVIFDVSFVWDEVFLLSFQTRLFFLEFRSNRKYLMSVGRGNFTISRCR